MTLEKIDFIRAKLDGIKTTLERVPASDKTGHIGITIAKDFNTVLQEMGEIYPELASGLPSPIGITGPFRQLGKAGASYTDLEILCEQVLNLVRLVR